MAAPAPAAAKPDPRVDFIKEKALGALKCGDAAWDTVDKCAKHR